MKKGSQSGKALMAEPGPHNGHHITQYNLMEEYQYIQPFLSVKLLKRRTSGDFNKFRSTNERSGYFYVINYPYMLWISYIALSSIAFNYSNTINETVLHAMI